VAMAVIDMRSPPPIHYPARRESVSAALWQARGFTRGLLPPFRRCLLPTRGNLAAPASKSKAWGFRRVICSIDRLPNANATALHQSIGPLEGILIYATCFCVAERSHSWSAYAHKDWTGNQSRGSIGMGKSADATRRGTSPHHDPPTR
jgi:hypothetical protein